MNLDQARKKAIEDSTIHMGSYIHIVTQGNYYTLRISTKNDFPSEPVETYFQGKKLSK